MADFIKQVMTSDGPKQIDYTALANLPTIDAQVINGSTNAVQGRAVFNELRTVKEDIDSLEDKFNENGQALDSAKFGGYTPSYYATASDVQTIAKELGLKLDGNIEDTAENLNKITEALNARFNEHGQALDAAKFGGQDPDYYATQEGLNSVQQTIGQSASDAQTTANNAMSLAQTAKDTADLAIPKASFVFNSSTGTLDITL